MKVFHLVENNWKILGYPKFTHHPVNRVQSSLWHRVWHKRLPPHSIRNVYLFILILPVPCVMYRMQTSCHAQRHEKRQSPKTRVDEQNEPAKMRVSHSLCSKPLTMQGKPYLSLILYFENSLIDHFLVQSALLGWFGG